MGPDGPGSPEGPGRRNGPGGPEGPESPSFPSNPSRIMDEWQLEHEVFIEQRPPPPPPPSPLQLHSTFLCRECYRTPSSMYHFFDVIIV